MKIILQPTYDTDNTSDAPEVEVRGDNDQIEFHLQWMERVVTFKRADLERVVEIFRSK